MVSVGFDQTKEQMMEHINNRGWKDFEHYHRHKSECGTDFGVQAIPHAILLDKSGRIVFMGDPSVRPNILADFETLLKDGQL